MESESVLLRLKQIIGDPKSKPPIEAIIKVSRSTWLNGVRDGIFPPKINITKRTVAWRKSDIIKLVEDLSKGEGHIE